MIRVEFRTRPTCFVEVCKYHGVGITKLADVHYLEIGAQCIFGMGYRCEDDAVELAINEGCRFPLDPDWDPEDLDPDFLDREYRAIHIKGLVLHRNKYLYLVEITHIRDARFDARRWLPVAIFLTGRSMHSYLWPTETP